MLKPARQFAHAILHAALLATLLAPASLLASPAPELPLTQAAGPGQLIHESDLASDAELVRFADDLLPALLKLRAGMRVRIAEWPVAPGVRRDVTIARHEIYAAGARILEVDGSGTRELPRSPLAFFWGTESDDPESGIFVSIDPAARTLESLTQSSGTQYALRALEPGKPGLHLLATAAAFEARATAGHKTSWRCGDEELLQLPALQPPRRGDLTLRADGADTLPAPQAVAKSGASNQATVAFDTDHQFLAVKFANDTVAATNYLATMVATINVMYERDLNIQLLAGTTFLRTAAAGDPYTQTSSGAANPNQLNEFSNYWSANNGAVPRTVAAMLSGKSPDPYSASGIAWVSGLCSASTGYSFNQLFNFAADSSSLPGDTLILGHEIGHNFGSRHTHCYNPPIDDCFNQEPGCYSGATSCPAPATVNGLPNVTGTVMSYCHLFGAGCTSTQVFHPRVVAVIDPQIQSALGVCITPASSAPTVTSVVPGVGSTAGGTPITVAGSGFQPGTTLTLGGVAATNVNVVDAGTLTATAGAHAAGTVDVTVTSGGMPGTLAGGFTYTLPVQATGFNTVAPCRLLDTRNANGPLGGPALAANQQRTFPVTGLCGIPPSAVAVSVNVTVVASTGAGFFALYPGNGTPPGTSTLNFGAGQVRAGNTVLRLATDGTGTFRVLNGGGTSAHFLLDVNGYFQ